MRVRARKCPADEGLDPLYEIGNRIVTAACGKFSAAKGSNWKLVFVVAIDLFFHPLRCNGHGQVVFSYSGTGATHSRSSANRPGLQPRPAAVCNASPV